MDLLIVEPLEAELMLWLQARHEVSFLPELAQDPRAFRQALYKVRAMIVPASVAIDAQALRHAPLLRAVGRVSAGAENIDVDACERAQVEVVRSRTASAQAEAEFMVGALLSLLRRVPVAGADGVLVGRELGAATVGLLGERFLQGCKPNQVIVSISHSGLFDEAALADVLNSGRVAAAWLDSLEPGALEPGRPLSGIETLQTTPRLASTTRESRLRSAWTVVKRIDELLTHEPEVPREFRATIPGVLADLAIGPLSS